MGLWRRVLLTQQRILSLHLAELCSELFDQILTSLHTIEQCRYEDILVHSRDKIRSRSWDPNFWTLILHTE